MTARLRMLVPMFPPANSGVGDYAALVARELTALSGPTVEFLNSDRRRTQNDSEFVVHGIARTSESLLGALADWDGTLLLQYSGYGYQPRGCPFWLLTGLQRWLALGGSRRLVTMFHELAAFGPPWTSAFWLSLAQKHIARRLAQLSERCMTNRQGYARFIADARGESPDATIVLPVFSNVGEPREARPIASRARRLVVFGGRSWRLAAFGPHREDLQRICQWMGITEIADVGDRIAEVPARLGEIPVVSHGFLSSQQTSELFLDSRAGFFSYPTAFLAKSGIFAAYCAHGVVPVGPDQKDSREDGLSEGTHYLLARESSKSQFAEAIPGISKSALEWYAGHSIHEHAKACMRLTQGKVPA